MKRLEVSAAVRHIYMSLGFKRFYWIRYIENYTDNWKNQSNYFLFCWRRPRPWFRRHQERM